MYLRKASQSIPKTLRRHLFPGQEDYLAQRRIVKWTRVAPHADRPLQGWCATLSTRAPLYIATGSDSAGVPEAPTDYLAQPRRRTPFSPASSPSVTLVTSMPSCTFFQNGSHFFRGQKLRSSPGPRWRLLGLPAPPKLGLQPPLSIEVCLRRHLVISYVDRFAR